MQASALVGDDRVILTRLDDRVRIEIGGRLFSEYRFRGAPKPCLSFTPSSSLVVIRR